MWNEILTYICFIIGGCFLGVGGTIYYIKKNRVIHDLFNLIWCVIIAILLCFIGVVMRG